MAINKEPKVVKSYVRKLKNKTSYVARVSRVVDGTRKTISVGSFDTLAEANQASIDYVKEISTLSNQDVQVSNHTVMSYIKEVWYEARAEKYSSTSSIKSFIQLVDESGLGNIKLNTLTRKQCRKFRSFVYKSGEENNHSLSTISKNFHHLNHLLDLAEEDGFIDHNPNYGIKIRRSDEAKRKDKAHKRKRKVIKAQRIWSFEQINKYLLVMRTSNKKVKSVDFINWWAVFTIGIYTGMRISEIAGLKFSDFDRKKQLINVQRGAVVNDAKKVVQADNNPKWGSFGLIPYEDEVKEALEQLEIYQDLLGIYNPDGFLFQYKDGGLIYPDYWQRMWKRVQLSVGIPEDEILPTSHYMRHTHASLLRQIGYQVEDVAHRLRHEDTRTSYENYFHTTPAVDRAMASKFSDSVKSQKNS